MKKIHEKLPNLTSRLTADKRYHHYSAMLFEIDNPQKVKPYFDKNLSFIERNEKMVYKVGFIVMFLLNIVQLFMH